MPDVLKVTFDHAQDRQKYDAATIALRGLELLGQGASDPSNATEFAVMPCPVTGTLSLRPHQLYPAWWTSNSGVNLKPIVGTGYEVNTGAKWLRHNIYAGAGSYIRCDAPSGEYIRTDAAVGLNRGIFLSYFAYGAGDLFCVLECGWSSTVTAAETAEIGLKVWSNGQIQIYKAGVLVGTGTVSGATVPTGRQDAQSIVAPRKDADQNVDLYIIPARRRELIIYSSQGNGFVHLFDDILETNFEPTITPNVKFFVRAGNTTNNLDLQFCPLTYPSTGTTKSRTYHFGRPPRTGQALYNQWVNPVFTAITDASVYGDISYNLEISGTNTVSSVALRNITDTAGFVPDGIENKAIVKCTLTSSGKYTPWLYGAVLDYETVLTQTNASEEVDVTDYAMSVSLDVPDDPFGTTASLILSMTKEEFSQEYNEEDPPVLIDIETETNLADEVGGSLEMSFRPVKLEIAGMMIFDGITQRPTIKDGMRDALKRWECEVSDFYELLEKYQFRTRYPLDEYNPKDMVNMLLSRVGFEGATNISNFSYSLPGIPDKNCEEWNEAIEVGDTGRQALEKIHRFVSDVVYGPHPGSGGMEFWFLLPEDLPTVPALTLYRTIDDAVAGGKTLDEAPDFLYDGWQEENLLLEGNEVVATGMDARTGNIIQSYAEDEDSKDPELAPSSRPTNWAGFPLVIGAASRSFKTQAATDKCVEALIPIATQVGKIGQFRANTFLFGEDGIPLWRMDLVTLDGIGDRRISSLSAQFEKEVESGRGEGVVRSASYTCGSILGKGGKSLAEIQNIQKARLAKRGFARLERNPLLGTGILLSRKVEL